MAQSVEEIFTPSSLEIALKAFEEEFALENMEPKDLSRMRTLELEHICKDGSTVWVEINVSFLRDTNGQPIGILGVSRDITERRQTEEALRKSEAQYRLLAEHMTDTIRLMDMNLKTTYLSPSVAKLRGFTYQEILELPLEKQITPESLKPALKMFSEEIPRMKADPGYNPIRTLDLEYYRKDGTTVWAESSFSLIRDRAASPYPSWLRPGI